MSFKQVTTFVAAGAATIALSAVAYADTGKSPNGAPGPAGNPNQPAAAQPQANGPAGPAGNSARGRSTAQHGKSTQSHGKSTAQHGKSTQSHGKSGSAPRGHAYAYGHAKSHGHSGAAPGHAGGSPGNSEQGHANNFGHGKITICHATKSATNPYVEITISVNGLHGHGPASDPRHHAGSWQDIIPAPEGGCPGTTPATTSALPGTTAPQPEVAKQATAAALAPAADAPQSLVLGARAAGGGNEPQNEVLGAEASGGNAPAAAQAVRAADTHGSLPFTGTQLAFVLIVAAVALLGGFALRRALADDV